MGDKYNQRNSIADEDPSNDLFGDAFNDSSFILRDYDKMVLNPNNNVSSENEDDDLFFLKECLVSVPDQGFELELHLESQLQPESKSQGVDLDTQTTSNSVEFTNVENGLFDNLKTTQADFTFESENEEDIDIIFDEIISSKMKHETIDVKSAQMPSLSNMKMAGQMLSLSNVEMFAQSNMRMTDQMSSIPSIKMAGQMSSIPNMKMADQMSSIPNMKMASQMSSIPNIKMAGQMSSISNMKMAGQMLSIPNMKMTGQISSIPNMEMTGQISLIPNMEMTGQMSSIPNMEMVAKISDDYLKLVSNINTMTTTTSQILFNQNYYQTPLIPGMVNFQTQQANLTTSEDMNIVDYDDDEEADDHNKRLSTFAEYKPMKFKYGKTHPDQVVETSSMSAVEPPDLVYNLKIIDEILDSGSLSSLQMEAIAYACQMHEKFLESDERAAFFLGDGPGVGKGRIIAGIVYENVVCGRSKAIWMSVSSDLRFDAIRDLTDVQCHLNVIPFNKLSYNEHISDYEGYTDDGLLFLTYSALIGTNNSSGVIYRSRIDQIIQWCGSDFDGILVFDECHKAKNLVPINGGKATKTALAVLEIQKQLPNARIVYCSATGATEPRNLAYMYRLGLWGPGTPFTELLGFLRAVEKRGVGGMEIVAMDMKLRGMYIARQLSFAGVTFHIQEVKLEKDFKGVYNRSVLLWNKIFKYSEKATTMCGMVGKSNTFFWAKYWSYHQRFFKYLCIASKVKMVVEIAKKALRDGKCILIGLQSTGESHISENDCNLERIVSTASGVLSAFVEKSFPVPTDLPDCQESANNITNAISTKKSQKVKRPISVMNTFDDEDLFIDVDEDVMIVEETFQTKKVKTTDNDTMSSALVAAGLSACKYSWGNSTNMTKTVAKENIHLSETQICLRWRQELLDDIDKLSSDLPANTLDKLIDEFGGVDHVAEMTGRKGRIVKVRDDVYAYRSRGDDELPLEYVNITERSKFMSGEKLIAIISEAASAGISLQSDRRCINRRKRVHITLELPWSADKAVQQFGRSHRSNQLYPPEYIFVISELAGEKRFASSVAKRLESLGALTHGDRRSSETRDLSQFNFENKHGRLALHYMLNSLANCSIPNFITLPTYFPEKNFLKDALEAFKNCGLGNFLKTSNFDPGSENSSTNCGSPSIKATTKISRFLNRLLGIEVDLQNAIFSFYTSILNKIIKDEKKAGKWDSGILDWGITGEKVIIDETCKYTIHSKNSDATVEFIKLSIERGVSYDELMTKYPLSCFEDGEGFYTISKYKNCQSVILVKRAQNSQLSNYGNESETNHDADSKFSRLYNIIRPNLGESAKNESLEAIQSRYSLLGNNHGKLLWNNQYQASLEQCTHFYRWGKCSAFARTNQCDHGKRRKTAYILSGAIFGIWNIIENTYGDLQIRISRITTTEGYRKVGIVVHSQIVDILKARLISAATDSFKQRMIFNAANLS